MSIMELNSNEVAALLSVSEHEVREWAYSGRLPIVDAQGGRLQFNRQAILEWALARGHPLNLGIAETEPVGLPPFAELFAPERFHYDVPGHSFAEVLRGALDVFESPPEEKELIYDLLVSREKLMTTAIGDGLAIPHLRVPVVVNVPRPALSIFCTREPIDMGALDGKPVHTLFLLLSLAPRQHLELLARLTFLFRHPEFVALLRERAKPERILNWIQETVPTEATQEKRLRK
jgi:nitrogen PTS system EIIA component